MISKLYVKANGHPIIYKFSKVILYYVDINIQDLLRRSSNGPLSTWRNLDIFRHKTWKAYAFLSCLSAKKWNETEIIQINYNSKIIRVICI